MMTPKIETLARRAFDWEDWRWMPGIAIVDSYGVRGYVVDIAPLPDPGAWVANRAGVAWLSAEEMGRCLPDLSDHATKGCVLALVREAWETQRGSDCIASTFHTGTGWGVGSRCASGALAVIVLPTYKTEAEALVAALKAVDAA